MGLEIYKPGQGKWARGTAYALGVALILFGGVRLYATINVPGNEWIKNVPLIGSVSIYSTIALVVVLFGMLLLHVVLNRPGMANLLLETEQELKKVSWPSKREVRNATMVVTLVTFTMAMLLYGFDNLLRVVFALVFGY